MKKIEILYAGNDKMFDGIYLSILTMLNRTKSTIRFTLLTGDLSNQNKSFKAFSAKHIYILKALIKKYNKANELRVIDCTKLYLKTFKNAFKDSIYTPYAIFRLFANNYYKDELVLYMDGDTLVCGDIAKAFDVDMNDIEMCVCRDKRIGRLLNHGRYFNSGVILFNIKKIKKTKLLEKAAKFCLEKKTSFFDQDALNYSAVKYKIWSHQYRFNYQRFRVKKDLVVYHFSLYHKKPKPWQIQKFNVFKNKYKWNMWDEDYQTYFDMKKSINEKLM